MSAEVFVLPTSFAQQRFWFLDQVDPQGSTASLSVALHLHLPLDVAALQQSLAALLQRHEILRTILQVLDGQPIQVIAPSLHVPLPQADLRTLPTEQQEAEVLHLANQQAQSPFDLAHGPLLRTTLLALGAQEHLLLLTLHHSICDGWSLGILCQELTTLYIAYAAGQPAALPPLPLQYADYALWQRQWLQGEHLAAELAYWQQQLAGAPTTLALPIAHPRLAQPSRQGARYECQVPQLLSEALKSLSRQEGVTLYMTLVAAFLTLLHRYSGQEDLLLGTVTAGRSRAELEPVLGCFVNTLLLRGDLSGNPPFRELLQRVRTVLVEALTHQEVPFETVVKALQPARQGSQTPLVSVLLTLDPPMPTLPPGWTLRRLSLETGTAPFELSLELEDRPEGLLSRFEYRTELFEAATIARLAGHWQQVLAAIVQDLEQRVGELPLLTEAERRQLLVEWNATAQAYPREQCLHQLFETQVERTPEAVAVVCADEQLTYRGLNRQANQLAHHLQRLGVGPEVLVGLCLERSVQLVVALLGVLKAGGAYMPLDPTYPQERLAFMLRDAQVPVLLTQERLVECLPEHAAHVICLDTDWRVIVQECEKTPISKTLPENLAYVLYTSGSTGQPKGVLVPHQALVNHSSAITKYYQLQSNDRIAQLAALSFDVAAEELFPSWLSGATVVLKSDPLATPLSDFLTWVKQERVTVLNLSTAYWHEWVLELPRLEGQFPSTLRLVIIGSEKALPERLATWQKLVGDRVRWINAYGTTETTITTTIYEPGSFFREMGEYSVPIGRPIANTQVYPLDQHLQVVPLGFPGELYIGGDGLARGYLHRPELTAERFIPNPFSSEPGARLYKTGDLARYRPDGNLEFLGRLDHQVKIRGFRVELGEIEAVLRQHPAVRQALVIAREDVHGETQLVAYVVPQQKQSATVGDLHRHALNHLPTYMLPSAFVLLEALPLTPNGKVDRRALPAPDSARTIAKDSYVAPMTLVQYQLLQIWEELLDVRPIGIRDNFFELGGHSLLAARLMHRIEQVCGKKLPLATLFAGATIEHLANALLEEVDTSSRAPLVAVQASGSKRPFFYLHGDWSAGAFYCLKLAHHLGPDQPFYVLEPYHFEGLLVPPPFEAMAAAHLEALRRVQPVGPYLLGGFCNGGLIAYEMARQLQAQGERVDLLLLIDPAAPASHHWLRSLLGQLGALLHLGPQQQFAWFLHLLHVYKYLRLVQYRQRWHDLVGDVQAQAPPRRRATAGMGLGRLAWVVPSVEAMRRNWLNMYEWVAADYRPAPYPGKLTVFWSSEGAASEQRGGWRRVVRRVRRSKPLEANEVEVQLIPGTHQSWRIEHHRTLADHLQRCLGQAHTVALRQ